MTRFIQMTDVHFVPATHLLYDMDPAARLARGIDLVNLKRSAFTLRHILRA
jgi:hypothetical protein